MGRKRQFDEDDALASALNVFWHEGYHGASMTSLLAAMGLSKSSFYLTFGSKQAVLVAALRRYSESMAADLAALAEREPPAQALRHYLSKASGSQQCTEEGRLGCMMMNIAMELVPEDAEVEAIVSGYLRRQRQILTEMIARGQAEGALRSDPAPEIAAALVQAVFAGLKALRKSGTEPALLDEVVRCLPLFSPG